MFNNIYLGHTYDEKRYPIQYGIGFVDHAFTSKINTWHSAQKKSKLSHSHFITLCVTLRHSGQFPFQRHPYCVTFHFISCSSSKTILILETVWVL